MLIIKAEPRPVLLQQEYHGYGLVYIEEIIIIEKEEHHTALYLTGDRKILSREPLYSYIEQLEGYGFFKSSRRSIFNIIHLRRIKEKVIVFINGKEQSISRRNRLKLLSWLKS